MKRRSASGRVGGPSMSATGRPRGSCDEVDPEGRCSLGDHAGRWFPASAPVPVVWGQTRTALTPNRSESRMHRVEPAGPRGPGRSRAGWSRPPAGSPSEHRAARLDHAVEQLEVVDASSARTAARRGRSARLRTPSRSRKTAGGPASGPGIDALSIAAIVGERLRARPAARHPEPGSCRCSGGRGDVALPAAVAAG